MLTGRLLVAAPGLADPNFVGTIVLVVSHDDQGALGLVLNRPTDEPVSAHVPEWQARLAEPLVVFAGGPVERDVAVALGEGAPDPCIGDVGLVHLDLDDPDTTGLVRVYSGYAGWGAGQLDAEVAEGAWGVVDARPGDIFHPRPAELWREVLRRQTGDLALWSTLPADPELN